MQYKVTKNHILPFLEKHINLEKPIRVLEIGCAEAGVLKAFTDLGHTCMGIELSEGRIKLAAAFHEEAVKSGLISFVCRDIYDIDTEKDLSDKFDLVILKDVIEHIHDQGKFMQRLKKYLKPNGKVFFGFPPWQMPFGGHQQICKNKIASKLPYYHLLPRPLYKGILSSFGESAGTVEALLEIKETGISVERFEKILKKEDFTVFKRQFFLINPIYEYKFDLKPRTQNGLLSTIPYFRNFYSTCAYYLVG